MAKNRERQKQNKKFFKGQEEPLNSRNEFGVSDLTPRLAVKELIEGKKQMKGW